MNWEKLCVYYGFSGFRMRTRGFSMCSPRVGVSKSRAEVKWVTRLADMTLTWRPARSREFPGLAMREMPTRYDFSPWSNYKLPFIYIYLYMRAMDYHDYLCILADLNIDFLLTGTTFKLL